MLNKQEINVRENQTDNPETNMGTRQGMRENQTDNPETQTNMGTRQGMRENQTDNPETQTNMGTRQRMMTNMIYLCLAPPFAVFQLYCGMNKYTENLKDEQHGPSKKKEGVNPSARKVNMPYLFLFVIYYIYYRDKL